MTATNGKLKTKSKEQLLGPAKTSGYKPYQHVLAQRPRDLPAFGFDTVRAMLLDSAVRLGLAMRSAPMDGVEIAYQQGESWIPGVQCKDMAVADYVLRQQKQIWQFIDAILTAQAWGWSAGEITYHLTDVNQVEINELLPRHAGDTRALIRRGEKVGTRVLRVTEGSNGHVDLPFPYAWFHTHRPDPGMHYGVPILLGAYSPFADKWFEGGALSVRRLFMFKDSYGGLVIGYPDSFTTINGVDVPNHDVAQQIVEQAKTGAVLTHPQLYDQNGNQLWTVERAKTTGGADHILQFPKDLDTEIFHGLEIPDDVIESETGAWAGKRIPLAAFYAGLDSWLTSIFRDLKKQVLEPLVLLNFGKAVDFSIEHKPLAEQAMEQQANAGGGMEAGQPGKAGKPGLPGAHPATIGNQGNRPVPMRDSKTHGRGQESSGPMNKISQFRMGLDPEEAVGLGVLSAAELVTAAKRVIDLRLHPQPTAKNDFETGNHRADTSAKSADETAAE